MAAQRSHIATLDGLRGVAALAVVVFHMTGQTNLGPFPPRSYLAVDFFFVLSGFVIARTYESRLSTNMSVWSFARIRLARLYPLILLGTMLGFAAKIGAYFYFSQADSRIPGVSVIFEALFFCLFLIPNKGMYDTPDGGMFPLDSPVWSLMLEIWANLIYGVLVRILTTPVLSFVVATGAVAIGISATIHHDLNGGSSLLTLGIGIGRVWFSFFAGVLIYRLLPADIGPQLVRVPAIIVAAMLILSFLPSGSWLGEWYDAVVVLVIYPAIVILGASDPISPGWRQISLMAGALSYPIYILHWPTVTHFAHFRNLRGPMLIAFLMLALLGTLIISYVANRWYDQPVRKLLGRRSSQDTANAVVTARAGPPNTG